MVERCSEKKVKIVGGLVKGIFETVVKMFMKSL